jgi:hypothetical protein
LGFARLKRRRDAFGGASGESKATARLRDTERRCRIGGRGHDLAHHIPPKFFVGINFPRDQAARQTSNGLWRVASETIDAGR